MTEMIWRVGRKVGRTIYEQYGREPSDADPLIGVMDTPLLARMAVIGRNRWPAAELAIERVLALPEREWDEADADSVAANSARAYNTALGDVRRALEME